jgi:hypothetical protein
MSAESLYRLPWDRVEFVAAGTEAPGHVFLHETGLAACMQGLKPPYAGEKRVALVAHQNEIAAASALEMSVGDYAWFDTDLRKAVAAEPENGFYLGRVTRAKLAGELYVLVDLNVKPITSIMS